MKKFASLVLAGALTLSMSAAVFATTTGVSAEEQKILDTAPSKARELGISTDNRHYQTYYSQTLTYMQQHDMDSKQVDGALKAMDDATAKAKEAMQQAGVSSLLELNESALKSLSADCIELIKGELEAVGIEVRISADGTVTIVEKTGNNNDSTDPVRTNTIFYTSNVIKQTGSDMTATVVAAATIVGAVAACGIVAKKKGLFVKAES